MLLLRQTTNYNTKSNTSPLVYDIISTILASNRGCLGQAIQWCQSNCKTPDVGCYGNKTWNNNFL